MPIIGDSIYLIGGICVVGGSTGYGRSRTAIGSAVVESFGFDKP